MTTAKCLKKGVLLSLGIVAFQFVWLFFQWGGERATMAFTDIIGIPAAFGATAACIWAARSGSGRSRRGWHLLAASVAFWGIGEMIWTYYELVLGQEVPFPSLADVGFLGLVPFAVAAMLMFPAAPSGMAARLRAVFDGLIIAGSVLFIGWATVLAPIYRDDSVGVLSRFLWLAYPLGDVVILAIAIYVMTRSRGPQRIPVLLIAGGLAALALADAGFTYLTIHEAYASGSLIDPLWTAGFLLISLGALRWTPDAAPSAADERRVGPVAILVPYVPFLVATGVAMLVQVQKGALEPFLFWTAIVVILFLAMRQILALWDNLSLNRDLEHRVAERTAELEQALVDLERGRELQDQFIRNASHELRTPLSIILGAMHLLSREPDLSIEATTTVGLAERASEHLRRLVEDLLLASGLTDMVSCERSPFDVSKEVKVAVDSFSKDPKQVRVRVRSSLVGIGDAERFGHVIRHLLSNALKHAPAGTAVGVEAGVKRSKIHIVVRDEGEGVPEHLAEEVFRPFYQVDGSPTRKHGGMGLGLYLARQLTEAMGGRLVLDPCERGASFRVVIDAESPSPRAKPRASASGKASKLLKSA